MGIRYSPYSTYHRGSRNNSVHASHTHNVSGHYPAVQTAYEYNAYTGATTGTLWARSNNGAAYSYSCDEESPINYPSNSAYLPSSESTTNSMGFSLSLSGLRTWEPVTHTNRGQQATACGLQQITGSITPTANQFISFGNSHTTMSSEPAFPGGLSSQANMMTSDRLLPDPAASRSQSVAKITSIDSVPMSLLHRPSNPWIETIPGSSQSSTSRTLSSGLSDGSESVSRSITSSASQDIGFGFIPISNSPQDGSVQPTAVVTAAETSQSTFECSRASFADYSRERCRTLSSESVARQHEEALAEAYGYGGESRCDPRSALHGASSGQLSNGQEYTRLRHESSQVNSPLEEYRQNSSSYEAGIPPRTASVSVNGSSGGY